MSCSSNSLFLRHPNCVSTYSKSLETNKTLTHQNHRAGPIRKKNTQKKWTSNRVYSWIHPGHTINSFLATSHSRYSFLPCARPGPGSAKDLSFAEVDPGMCPSCVNHLRVGSLYKLHRFFLRCFTVFWNACQGDMQEFLQHPSWLWLEKMKTPFSINQPSTSVLNCCLNLHDMPGVIVIVFSFAYLPQIRWFSFSQGGIC